VKYRRADPEAKNWKANYHDTRAMMNFIDAFAGN
jgi:hypothetical protein